MSTGAASIPLLGGTLLIDPNLIAQIPFVTFLGTGQATLDVPNEASLAGLDLFLQAVILDLTSGNARWSNGLTGTLSS